MKAALRGRSRTRRGEHGGATEPCRSGGIPQRRDSALSYGSLGTVWRPALSRKAPEKAFMAGGSQGLPAVASPVPASHQGCCRRTRDLQRAAHAESVLWRREGERAGIEGRRGRGAPLAPLCNAAVPGEGRQRQRSRKTPAAGTRGSGRAVHRSVTLSARRERNGKGSPAPVWPRLESLTASPSPPPALLCPAWGPRREDAGACRGSRRLLGGSPLPGHACPSPAGEAPTLSPPPCSSCCLSRPILQ